jgi:hypothetical protein
MRIVSNERRIRFFRILATTTSLVGTLLLLASLVLPAVRPEEYSTPPFGLALIAVAISALGLNLANYWLKPPLPHEALDEGLKGFGSKSVLYHYHLPVPHVLVCPQGVFSLTVKPQRVAAHVEGDIWRRRETTLTRIASVIFRQDSLGNPSLLAQRQARRLQDWLDKHLGEHDIAVQPIVVFSNLEAILSVQEPILPATYADKRKPSLKATLRNLPKGETLLPEQVSILEQAAGIPTPA